MEFLEIRPWHLALLLLLPILYWASRVVWLYSQWPLWMRRSLRDLPPVVLAVGYRLRSFRRGDEEAWVQLVNTTFAGEKCVSVRMRRSTFERQYTPKIRAGRVWILFIEQEIDGDLVGTTMALQFGWKGPETGLIAWMAVHPAHRGRGLGAALLSAALHSLRDRDYKQAVLSTNPKLSAALRLYRRLGFVPVNPRAAAQMLRHSDGAETIPCE
jgi:ribosomal protein S18 acetylase RimI-like enzyme